MGEVRGGVVEGEGEVGLGGEVGHGWRRDGGYRGDGRAGRMGVGVGVAVGMELVWMELGGLCLVGRDGGERRGRCDRERTEIEGEAGRGRAWVGAGRGGLCRKEKGPWRDGGGEGLLWGEVVGRPDGLGRDGLVRRRVGIVRIVHLTELGGDGRVQDGPLL